MDEKMVNIFYSYSHKDKVHKENMEKFLTILRREKIINEWSDKEILAGQNIQSEISAALAKADVVIFLISIDFLNSDACIQEWDKANEVAKIENKKLISVILRECPWSDFSNMSESLALPYDGKPISLWDDLDSAWQDVYKGIKRVIQDINK